MNKIYKGLKLLLMAVASVMVVACNNEPQEQGGDEKKFIVPDELEVYLDSEATTEAYVVPVLATDNEWQMTQDDISTEWCTVATELDEAGAKALYITATENTSEESREAYITLFYDMTSVEVMVVQTGAIDEQATEISCDSMVIVSKDMGEVEFAVEANGAFEVVIPEEASWLLWEDGKFFYSASYNEEPRQTEVVIKSDYAEAKVTFIQVGTKEFSIEKEDYTLSYKEGTLTIPVQKWVGEPCAVTSEADWISVDSEATTLTSVVLNYTSNEGEEPRQATVVLSSGNTTATITIDQVPFTEYDKMTSDNQVKDWVLAVTSAEASSQLSASRGAIIKAYDQNDKSWWATTQKNQEGTVFYTMYFAEEQEMTEIQYFRYCPTNAVSWGMWGEVEVYVTERGGSERLLLKEDFGMTDCPKTIYFDEPLPVNLEKATIKILTAKPFSETVTNVASAASIEFGCVNPENFDMLAYFTDLSCSELREEITYEDILAIKDPFYRSMALQIFNGDWSRFRVCEAKAYPHPDRDAAIFFTPPHTLLDNVTGMYAAEVGEPQYIFVEEDYGQEIYVRFCDMVNDEGLAERVVGRCESDFRIYKGKNVIIPNYRGLMYIIWHTDDYEKFPPIKINFATGHVNGFFYLDKDDPEDFYRLLSLGGSTEPHFDMLSDKVIMNFPKETIYNRALKRNGKNSAEGARLVAIFDTIVRQQERWQGHDKYKALGRQRGHRNRAPFFTLYGNAVAGSGVYRTGYGINSILQDVTDPIKMWNPNTTVLGGSGTTDADKRDLPADVLANNTIGTIWGVAHEIGHSNQCRPFAWRGLTEVTNNLMCVGTQAALFGEGHTTLHYKMKYNEGWRDIGHRYITDFDENGNEVERKMTLAEAANTPAAGSSGGIDPAATLVPFWQLFLYYHYAMGNTDFYPDFFEQCRLRGDIFFDHGWDFRSWSGNQEKFDKSNREQSWAMTDYMIKISMAAGEDLSDWALHWGIPGVNKNLRASVYGQNIINTTQEMIDEAVAECRKYPKPRLNPFYICDSNLDLYRNPKTIVQGTHTVEAVDVVVDGKPGQATRYNVSGWENVAAWVLYDPIKKRDVACFEGRFTSFSYREFECRYILLPDGATNPEGSRYQYDKDGYGRSTTNVGPTYRPDLLLYAIHPDGSRVPSLANPAE
ncbi:MAG: hypothetical protein E7128_05225 [Rikenellaceae bacterium]|nr:hypothetical protein [Rikenellaceae bacterium]